MLFFKQKEYIGIIFVILAYFSFSLLDAVQKTAIIYHSVFQLLFFQVLMQKNGRKSTDSVFPNEIRAIRISSSLRISYLSTPALGIAATLPRLGLNTR